MMQALFGLVMYLKNGRLSFHVSSQITKDITNSHVAMMQALAGFADHKGRNQQPGCDGASPGWVMYLKNGR